MLKNVSVFYGRRRWDTVSLKDELLSEASLMFMIGIYEYCDRSTIASIHISTNIMPVITDSVTAATTVTGWTGHHSCAARDRSCSWMSHLFRI